MLTVLYLLISVSGVAQSDTDDNPKKFKLYLTEGLGVSYFHYDVRELNHKVNNKSCTKIKH